MSDRNEPNESQEAMLDKLCQLFGAKIEHSDIAKQTYGLDWTRFYEPHPLCIFFPEDNADVSAMVRFAVEHELAIVPSGGRTGLSGGAVARQHEIVVSFEKMNKILSYDKVDEIVEVQAGVITQVLQNFALENDRYYPVDFASSGSSQIGGNIATNAGGIKVLRYGLTRQWVAGLKVVTGTGEILELNKGLTKNATGYDLRHLFIGSEGTLGLIVEASIKLTNRPANLSVAFLAVPKMADCISVLNTFKQALNLTAFEFLSHEALCHVLRESDESAPFDIASDYYVLAEYESPLGQDSGSDSGSGSDTEAAVLAVFESCVEQGWVIDGVISQSEAQARRLWRYREGISESITPFTPYKNDIAVRISKIPELLEAVEHVIAQRCPEFEIVWFGHIGDGNVHLNILKPADWETETFKSACEIVSEEVMAIVATFEGSISAEHGVGLLKRNQLPYSRSEEEIRLMKSIKQVFDPKGIMNPGKMFPAS
ncbi:MAG: FAD/FMN-containing dehydrogenase [Candidatus Azotimanducaceae bacterium]